MSVGQRLKSLRAKMKLSQQALSERVGLNRATYARYETDDNQADYETLQKLADFFEVSIDYLLGRTDNPTVNGIEKKSAFEFSDEDRPLTKGDVEELFADDPEGKELMLLMMELPPEKKKIVKELLKQFRETEK